jgi:hypothetical protein
VLGISPTLVRALAAHEERDEPPSDSSKSEQNEEGFPQSREDAKEEQSTLGPNSPPSKGGMDAASVDVSRDPSSPPSKGGVDAASADGVVLSSSPTESMEGRDQANHPALAEPRAPLLSKEGSSLESAPSSVDAASADVSRDPSSPP